MTPNKAISTIRRHHPDPGVTITIESIAGLLGDSVTTTFRRIRDGQMPDEVRAYLLGLAQDCIDHAEQLERDAAFMQSAAENALTQIAIDILAQRADDLTLQAHRIRSDIYEVRQCLKK